MRASFGTNLPSPRHSMIPVEQAELFCREVGQGQPLLILHGGLSLDHTYLLPDMDRLSDAYRLIYYDQRGRGKSIGAVADISLQSELEDLDGLRQQLGLDSVAVLGHSWGGVLAMEYALRYPQRVSHLILLHTAPASQADYQLYAQEWAKRRIPHESKLAALQARYKEGELGAVAEFCRIYFGTAIKQPEHLERMNLSLSSFTKDSMRQAQAIQERLLNETWRRDDFDIVPRLPSLRSPTLVVHGDYDFVPVDVSARIARAIPGARFVLFEDCGHFSYLEAPEQFHSAIDAFFAGAA